MMGCICVRSFTILVITLYHNVWPRASVVYNVDVAMESSQCKTLHLYTYDGFLDMVVETEHDTNNKNKNNNKNPESGLS